MLSQSERGVDGDLEVPIGSLLEPMEAVDVVVGELGAGFYPRVDTVDLAEL